MDDGGFSVEANRQEYSWNVLMHILDTMALITDGKFCSLKRWYELFMILVSSGTLALKLPVVPDVGTGFAFAVAMNRP